MKKIICYNCHEKEAIQNVIVDGEKRILCNECTDKFLDECEDEE